MAVGNGAMWVADQGTDIVRGEYLISSDVSGHAERDPKTADVSNIIARASEDINWSDVSAEINGVKHKRITVFFESFTRVNMDLAAIASSTVELSELGVDSSAGKFMAGLLGKLTAWFGDAQNGIGSMYANVFNASERICVDGECLTADDIRALKGGVGGGSTGTGSSGSSSSGGGDVSGGSGGDGGTGAEGTTGSVGDTGSTTVSGGDGSSGGSSGDGSGGGSETPPTEPTVAPPEDTSSDGGGSTNGGTEADGSSGG